MTEEKNPNEIEYGADCYYSGWSLMKLWCQKAKKSIEFKERQQE